MLYDPLVISNESILFKQVKGDDVSLDHPFYDTEDHKTIEVP